MQEAHRRVDHDVAGQEQFFAAGTDIYREVAWRVTGVPKVVTPGTTSAMALIRRSRGGQFQIFTWVTSGCCLADTLPTRSGALQKATSVSLATNSAEGNSSDAFLPSLIPHRWSKWA